MKFVMLMIVTIAISSNVFAGEEKSCQGKLLDLTDSTHSVGLIDGRETELRSLLDKKLIADDKVEEINNRIEMLQKIRLSETNNLMGLEIEFSKCVKNK
jgi:hypothetical protein